MNSEVFYSLCKTAFHVSKHLNQNLFFEHENWMMIYNEGHLNQNDGTVVYIKNIYRYYKLLYFKDSILLKVEANVSEYRNIIHAFYRSPSTCLHNLFVENMHINIFDENDNKVNYYLSMAIYLSIFG